jgi:hypothetical protein
VSDFDPAALFRRFHQAGVRYIVIGGWAVNAHGHRRFTGDLDICPDPSPENLHRLASLLADLHAEHLGAGDFEAKEMPGDPTDPDSLAEGGNFRVVTDLGIVDVMQWVPGIEDDHVYERLAADAVEGRVFGAAVKVCSLENLRAMKRAADRPVDRADLEALD